MGAASSFNALDADTYYTKTQVQSLFQENGIPSMDFTKTFEENAEADGSISGATLRYLVQTQEQNHQQLGPPPQKNKQPSLVRDLSWYGRDDAVDKKQADSAIPGLQPGLELDDILECIARYVKSPQCKSIVFLTGAGLSTGAGIPDFRSVGGMYDTLRPELLTATEEQRRMMKSVETHVVSAELFAETPLPYLELRRPFILGTQEEKWKPTLGHRSIELFARKLPDKFTRLYTQNIDGLDYQCSTGTLHKEPRGSKDGSGSVPVEKIIPVHGSMATVTCEACGAQDPMDYGTFCSLVRSQIKDIYGSDSDAPSESTPILCPVCKKSALKPSTVLYGNSVKFGGIW